jgi:hypothetical protein
MEVGEVLEQSTCVKVPELILRTNGVRNWVFSVDGGYEIENRNKKS